MIIKIDDEFIKNGLSLEEAYILGRIKSFNDEGFQYEESNRGLAEAIGKTERVAIKYINNLILKGYLNKKTVGKRRILSISEEVIEKPNIGVVEKPHIWVKSEPSINELSAEEKARRLQELINETRDPNFDITEEMY